MLIDAWQSGDRNLLQRVLTPVLPIDLSELNTPITASIMETELRLE
jgi:hypothetical protein